MIRATAVGANRHRTRPSRTEVIGLGTPALYWNPTMTDASDVEIYITAVKSPALVEWLSSELDQLEPLPRQAGMMKNANGYRGHYKGESFTVMILEKVIGSFTSLWIDSKLSPWSDDLACARAATAHFQKEVRVAAGPWQEKDDPDAWISIKPDGTEVAIQWQTAS